MIRRDRLGSLGVVIAAHLVLALVLLYSLRTTTRRVPAADVAVMPQLQAEPPTSPPPPPQPVAKPLVPATPDLPLVAPVTPVATAVPAAAAPVVENIQENAAPSAPPQPKAHLDPARENQVAAEDGGPSADASAAGNPKPVYPKISRSLGEQGRVLLDVYVQADGTVGEIRLHQSCGYDRLDESALHAVRQWRFKPARQAGKQVAAWYVQPITFSLQNA